MSKTTYILALALLLIPSLSWGGAASKLRGVMGSGSLGIITLNADGTYTSTGPAIITPVLDVDGENHYFTIDFPAQYNVTSIKVTAAGAAGAKWNSGTRGNGCIITASGVPVSSQLKAKIGVKPPDDSYNGGYGGGRGYDGSGSNGTAGGGGSTSLAYVSGNVILLEAGAGGGAAGGGTGADATGDGGGTQDATHGNQNGYWIAAGGGWTSSHTAPYPASSKIVSGSGSYATGASGNSGAGYMVITY